MSRTMRRRIFWPDKKVFFLQSCPMEYKMRPNPNLIRCEGNVSELVSAVCSKIMCSNDFGNPIISLILLC